MKKAKLILVALLMLPLLLSTLAFGQSEKMIEGQVSDENGNPLAGVNVIIQGTTTGTITDANGKFNIQASEEAALTFSFVGYKRKDVVVKKKKEINVTLEPDVTQLSDVVVVGYGTQRRQNLTGSVSDLTSDKIESKAVSSVESALQGQVSGLSVVNTGSPGTSPTVRIRGIGSINFSSDPLYVIDGVPVDNLNNFNINDMQSVSVLKDASAAAIYGSRAANGVILITTKKGTRDGKITLNIDASTGLQQPWKKLDLLNREEYIEFGTELLTNAGTDLPYRFSHMDDPIYEGTDQTYAETQTNWQDEMFRTAPMTQINVGLSGGDKNYRLYTSYGRFAQDGIMLGTNYNRHSLRINTEGDLNRFLTIGENLKASFSQKANQRIEGGRTIMKHTVNQVPYIPVLNPNNKGGYGGPSTVDGSDACNPVRIASMDDNMNHIVNLVGNAFAEITFTDWLNFRSSYGINYTTDRNTIRLPIYNTGYNQRNNNELTDNRNREFVEIFTNQLTYDHSFGKHDINAVLVGEQQKTNGSFLNGSGMQPNNDINQLSGATSQSVDGEISERILLSYAARLNYAFADKYLLNASFRRDGSSVFAPGKKWANFPGGSIGWVISEENFMQNIEVLSNLKLRASYGSVGFNAVNSAYPWQSVVYTNTSAVFNNSENIGAYYHTLPNEDLEWEITHTTNAGFDLGLFDYAFTLSAEYYIREVDNLIVGNPLPTSMGYAIDPLANVGSMKNWGYDFEAGYNQRDGEFQYSISANISFVNNEVLELSSGQPNINREGVTSDYGGYTITRTEEGEPIQYFYGWVTDGIFQSQDEIDALNPDPDNNEYYQTESTAPGDIKFKDLDGNGYIDEDDRTNIGSHLPDFTYGMNISADYKGIDASLFLQGVYGNEIYNGTKVLTQGMMRLFNQDKAVLDAWTPENTNTDIPRAIDGDPSHNVRTSDRFVEDGSYMRIKEFTIGYNFSENMMSSWFKQGTISKLRLYFTAQNLLTLTGYSGYDPEIGASSNYSGENSTLLHGVDFGFYPQPRTYMIGISTSF